MPEKFAERIEQSLFSALSTRHQGMIRHIAEEPADSVGMCACFAPGTPNAVMDAFNQAIFGVQPNFFQQTRWRATARDPGSTGVAGTPTILTYSFVPDGTAIGSGAGEPAAPSDLFAYMRALYGSDAAWQAQYHAIFARWGELCGVTYVYEPNDDGVGHNTSPGVNGVRGDLRLGGHFIDGNSGILAYNYFPQSGDMVIDTGDNFFATTSGNSLRLRNVLAHEHGHGMGQSHVCPIQQTKLMEPFVSTAYDGPRHDDLRNAQQHYGDAFEPNGTAALATPIGSLAIGGTISVGGVSGISIPNGTLSSLNINGDVDYYKVTASARLRLVATVTPQGLNYEDTQQACSGQNGSCCTGAFTNSLTMADLNIEVIASNGTTVLNSASAAPAGSAETVGALLPSAGDYYIRITGASAPAQVQAYTVSISGVTPALDVTLPAGAPQFLAPGVPNTFAVMITPIDQTVATANLRYRVGVSGTFLSAPLTFVSGNNWTAALPPLLCGQSVQFYVEVTSSGGAVVRVPETAPTSVFTASVGLQDTVLDDAFETNLGWTVNNDASLTTGAWVRVDPNGTAAQPEDDHTPTGTQCYVTGQGAVGGGVGDADIDGGATRLISPTFDLSNTTNARISYWRWYSNTQGGAPAADIFTVDISSDNGGNWTNLETVGPATENNGGWLFHEAVLSNFPAVARTATMKIRFVASDLGTGSVVEAAVDDVLISREMCVNPSGCGTADFDGDGDVGTDSDIEAFFSCLGGSCCATCFAGGADFNGDGDVGTDADIEAFFRVLAGGNC